ncbi:MAG TPA: tRNA (N6-isopentenyl adenosine(37)-C2)-methylthiotransferase MiaB [Methyloceanibacter sp.]|nr:tRNA (N6-isopentenyl adenosine(37)-C2)-methylthiotransferase MiaB [Methyloceanibacter sp.]
MTGAPNTPQRKKVHIKTFGCQMNAYDSERMAESLEAQGYAQTEDGEDADLVILNTCHIREKAAEKVYSELGRVRMAKERRKRDGRDTIVAVAGCVAQAEGQEIIARAPAVDIVVGPQSYHRLAELIEAAAVSGKGVVATDFPAEEKFAHLPERRGKAQPSAFVTVQEGCDKFCTFCVVPYTRGAEFSRSVEAILAEVKRLAANGTREITLLGQNVNAYHGAGPNGRDWTLAGLLRLLAQLPAIERLRYTTSHPLEMNDELIALFADEPKLMPYLHLPFQAGANRILKAMNRKHSAAEYEDAIGKVREARPDIALSTDIIVGFPGETDEDFAATLALAERIRFAQAFTFKYSARPGTPAADLDGQVPEDVKRDRLHQLQRLIDRDRHNFDRATVGRRLDVLFEGRGRKPGQIAGRSPYLQAVHAEGPEGLIGRIAAVDIEAASPNSLRGVIKSGFEWHEPVQAAV